MDGNAIGLDEAWTEPMVTIAAVRAALFKASTEDGEDIENALHALAERGNASAGILAQFVASTRAGFRPTRKVSARVRMPPSRRMTPSARWA